MLTFIKSLITYIAWLQKVTFLQKGTKAIYSIIEFKIRATEPFSEETRRPALPLPWQSLESSHSPSHSKRQSLKLGGRVGLGDVAQLVPRELALVLQATQVHSPSLPGTRSSLEAGAWGSQVVRERLGPIHALGLPGVEDPGVPGGTGASTCVLGGGGKTREQSVSAERRRGGGRPQTGRRQGGNLVSTSS